MKELFEELDKELDILDGHIPILKIQKGPGKQKQRNFSQLPKLATSTALLSTGGKEARKCPFCHEEHNSQHCDKARHSSERKKLLFKSARYFSCLIPGHISSRCRLKMQCRLFKGKGHHVAICSSFTSA